MNFRRILPGTLYVVSVANFCSSRWCPHGRHQRLYNRWRRKMQRPSTSQGGRSVVTDAETAYCARRPNTATVPGRDRSTFSSSFQLADSLNSDKLEYRKRLDEWRQMSAPELRDARLSQADFLRFARPGQLTGIRDKLKLETLSRAYGVARATSHRPQLSPVRNKRLSTCTGSTPPTIILSLMSVI